MAKEAKNTHSYRIGSQAATFDDEKEITPLELRKEIEPWLSAIFQCEHLNCLVGSGLTHAIAHIAKTKSAGMDGNNFGALDAAIKKKASISGKACGRDSANIEDLFRTAYELLAGLKILDDARATELETTINNNLKAFLTAILKTETALKKAFSTPQGIIAEGYLTSFLMSFASRLPSRERLNIFTTNYDRLIEHGCDQAGIRTIDRFVGALTPVFRSSRLNVDMHYNPPGIRGEPRYLEGIARIFKLHGSLDWRTEGDSIVRHGIGFGDDDHRFPDTPGDSIMIYPNAAKDMETLNYPYAELFRDFAASVCRPNAALVVYGFGFGDDHINRTINDMLKIPSTHLVIITLDMNSRIQRLIDEYPAQVTYLHGTHFANLKNLVEFYLPKPAIDPLQSRQKKLKEIRDTPNIANDADDAPQE